MAVGRDTRRIRLTCRRDSIVRMRAAERDRPPGGRAAGPRPAPRRSAGDSPERAWPARLNSPHVTPHACAGARAALRGSAGARAEAGGARRYTYCTDVDMRDVARSYGGTLNMPCGAAHVGM